MNKTRHIMAILAGIFFLLPVVAQERLTGLEENPLARPQPSVRAWKNLRNAPAVQLLPLPFIDNFMPENPWPDVSLWTTNGVYVNDHYAVNMPVAGVATFDALGANGKVHSWLGASSAPADTLTSLPIDLSSAGNVVLSFFYQAGGLADIPGTNDRLRLEFYSPADSTWTDMWSASVSSTDSSIIEFGMGEEWKRHRLDTLNTQFVYTAITLDDQWLQAGFRFRFYNLVSLAVNIDAPGRANNADAWHLGLVYLDKNRNADDPHLPDVGIAAPQGPVTKGYEAIPASHLNVTEAQQNLFGPTTVFTLTYRNLGWGTRNVARRFSIRPLYGSSSPARTYSGGSENIFDLETHTRVYDNFEPYNYMADADDAAFEIRSYLVTDVDNTPLRQALRKNDTTTYIQHFSDYYAYDDGSAENGYGLFGYGTGNGRVAVQFQSFRTDSLRGVYLYFNFAKDSANIQLFKLAVWNDNDGQPGSLLYLQDAVRPVMRDSLNAYVAYKFNKPIPISRGQQFYVGWIQTTEAFLNIGFDVNRSNGMKNFYSLNTFGDWFTSIYEGSLMMRPIFCRPENFPDDFVSAPAPTNVKEEDNYLLYPNPASDIVFIRNLTAEEQMISSSARQEVEVYDLRGQLLLRYNTSDGYFPVADLPAGMYVVRIIENNIVKTSRKIIITR